MKFKRNFGRKKESKPIRGLFLVALLAIALLLWYKAGALMELLF
jgi:hypothetical protein